MLVLQPLDEAVVAEVDVPEQERFLPVSALISPP